MSKRELCNIKDSNGINGVVSIEHLLEITRHIPISCCILDENFQMLFANKKLASICGFENEEKLIYTYNKVYNANFRRSDMKKLTECFEELKHSDNIDFEWKFFKREDETIYLEVSISKFETSEQNLFIVYAKNNTPNRNLKQVYQNLEILIDGCPMSCSVWDEKYHLITCNEQRVLIHGASSRQDLVENFNEFIPEFQKSGKKSLVAYREFLKIAFDKGKYVADWQIYDKDKQIIPTEIVLVRILFQNKPAVICYMTDLRDIEFLTDEINIQAELSKNLIESNPLFTSFWDEDVNMVMCNKAWFKQFGITEPISTFKDFLKLSPKYQADGTESASVCKQNIIDVLTTNQTKSFNWIHQTIDGDEFPCRMTLTPISLAGKRMVAGYGQDLRSVDQTRELLHKYNEIAHKDSLTGIYNRRYFEDYARTTIDFYLSRHMTVSVLFLDLDDFKCINDRLGHAKGDKVIKSFVKYTSMVTRSQDVFCRYGGEEFIIIATNISKNKAMELANRICKNTRRASAKVGVDFTVSVGVASGSDISVSLDSLIERADDALYKAKSQGKDQVVFYEEKKNTQ